MSFFHFWDVRVGLLSYIYSHKEQNRKLRVQWNNSENDKTGNTVIEHNN